MFTHPISPTMPGEPGDDALEIPERGTSIGRFLVLGPLGMGGMALVLSAYDPQLDRKVALKVMRGDVWRGALSQRGQEQLVREAQAMARLSHPNVVTVYEVVFVDDSGYVVMEQIDGRTLRVWLKERERGWQQIVAMLTAAGEGLLAAHQAGLVHHDFKPENILVGEDGRPRVSDFGLAGAGTPGAGTRSYMAPEQLCGERVDARADVYAFCVTLWEALQDERPPGGAPLPAARKAPRWVYQVLARGLASHPGDRWPSMAALLGALRRRRSRGLRTGAGAIALCAVGVAAFLVGAQRTAIPSCDGAGGRLAGVWDAARRHEVGEAFAAAHLPFGDDAWRGTSVRLDAYARDWAGMYTETCRATRLDGRQSEALLDLRMGCLERRRAQLGALTDAWARGVDRATVAASVTAVAALPSVAECADVRALSERTPPPSDRALAARVATGQRTADAARAAFLSGRRLDAVKLAAEARAEADATGWPQLRAEAAYVHGLVTSSVPAGADDLLLAAQLAEQTHDDHLAAEALLALTHNIAAVQQDAARALLVADLADGMVLRAGNDERLRARLLLERGNALQVAGKLDEARAAYGRARSIALAAFGPEDIVAVGALAELATVAHDQGDYADARRLGEESLAATITALGPKHPDVVAALSNLGRTAERQGELAAAADYYGRALLGSQDVFGPGHRSAGDILNKWGVLELRRGDLDRAAALLERGLAIYERELGPDDPYVASVRTNLAIARRKQGRRAEARQLLERALAVKLKVYGPAHRSTAYALENMGATLSTEGDFAGALDYQRRALDVRTRALGAGHEETLGSMVLVADALASLHRCAQARPLLAVARPALERALGPGHSDTVGAISVTARCDLDEGRSARALAALRRALALLERADAPAVDRGVTRWLEARALWGAGRRQDAVVAARAAERELAGDADGARDRAAARAWLAAR